MSTKTANNFFDGLIDEVRVYEKALSAAQIKNVYDATPPLVLYELIVNSGTGTVAFASEFPGKIIPLELADGLQGPQESLLDAFAGVFGGSGHLICQSIKSFLMVTYQGSERLDSPGLGLSNEFGFVNFQAVRAGHLACSPYI